MSSGGTAGTDTALPQTPVSSGGTSPQASGGMPSQPGSGGAAATGGYPPVNDPTGIVNPPAGRLAIVADGNSPDPDDIGATAVMFGILEGAGLRHRLVHLSHSCDLRPNYQLNLDGVPGQTIPDEDELRRQRVLGELCEDGIAHFGPFPELPTYFNNRTEQDASVAQLRDAIDASSAADPLWIVEAGEPDIIGFALEAARPEARAHVHVISHHPANDNAGDFFTWQEILDFGVTEHQIGDQNTHLKVDIKPTNPWSWARDHEEPGLAWIWDRLDYAERDGVVRFQTDKFDCSDAGIVYWWITGADQGGNATSTVDDMRELLLR